MVSVSLDHCLCVYTFVFHSHDRFQIVNNGEFYFSAKKIFRENMWIEVSAILLLIASLVFLLKFICRRKPKSIRGKIVLVTGGGNGLGRELCIKFSQQGCKVAIADIDYDGCLKTIELMEKVDLKAYKVDLLKVEDIDSLKEQVLKDFGTIDILVNNAGLISFATIFHESVKLITSIIGVNLIAPILLTRAIMPLMINQRSGHIVTISSASGIYSVADANTYGASKFGVSGFMMGLRELIRRKKLDKIIYTTTVYPMPIATNDDVQKVVNVDK